MRWNRGDWVNIECDGHESRAMILLASENGKSLMVGFDGMLGGHFGMMPVLHCEDGAYRSIVTGAEVRIKPAAPCH